MSLESLGHDFRYAARNLRTAPAFGMVCVITLALGIGANTAAFGLVNAWLIRPLPLKDPQQLVSVWRTQRSRPREPQYFNLYDDYVAWAANSHSLQQLAATFDIGYALTGAGEAEEIHGAVATWNLFEVAGVNAESGRLFQREDVNGAPACIISHALWVKRFASSPDAIGRSIELNGKLYRILGVLPTNFSLRVLDRPFDNQVWTLLSSDDPNYNPTAPSPVAVIGRLKPGIAAAQAETELTAIQRELDTRTSPDHYLDAGILVVNLQQDNARTVRSSLLLLFAAVVVLLLIACVNVGSLILGRASSRTREFAVRLALGCGATRLLQQIAVEVVMLFVLGGIAGLVVAEIALRTFVAANPFGLLPPGGVTLDWRVLLATAAVVLFAALIFGSLPAYRSIRMAHGDALRTGPTFTSTLGHLRARAAFVTAEFAFSFLLLVAAGLLVSTFWKINAEPLGYSTNRTYVAEVSLPTRDYSDVEKQGRFADDLLLRLRMKPGIIAAGVATSWPFQLNGLNPVEFDGSSDQPTSQMPQAAWLTASDGYFDALGIPLLRGRSFAASDNAAAPHVAIINQQMARRLFDGEDPIGQHLRIRYIDDTPTSERNPWLTVIGVVGDTRSQRYNALQWDRYPVVYSALRQRQQPKRRSVSASTVLYIYLRSSTELNRSTVATAADGLDPNVPVGSFRPTGEIVAGLTSQPRIRAGMFATFGALALLLAAIGIYGLMSQNVEQRRREIGIRMALGALGADIVQLMLGRALTFATFGLLLGFAVAIALNRALRSFVYGVSTLNVAIYGGAVVASIIVAVLASYLPARRASGLDPAVVLRAE